MKRILALSSTLLLLAAPVLAQENPVSDLPKIAPEAEADVETVGQALQGQLIELQNLALQAKQAHWNVSGTLYYPLHELLQEHYEGYTEYADRVAELSDYLSAVIADGVRPALAEAGREIAPGSQDYPRLEKVEQAAAAADRAAADARGRVAGKR